MKNKLIFPALILLVIVVFTFSCNKNRSSDLPVTKEPFNTAEAKEWYYGTFKKSTEWASSSQKGKKLPDWKNPVILRRDNSEIIEFPLIQESTRCVISASESGKTLSQAQILRIAEASITKIAFIKEPTGIILVREIDYIPDLDYLESKKYDIGAVNLFSSNNDFSGKVIVKKWGGEIITKALLKNGKVIKRGSLVSKTQTSKAGVADITDETCYEQEQCIWQQDCTLTLYSDGMITEFCGAWYNTGECWMEYWCDGGGDPCEIAGISCGGDDDGGDPNSCSQESVDEIVQSASTSSLNEKTGITTISASPFSITRSYKWKFAKIVPALGSGITLYSTETGIQNKGSDGWWRWTSFNHTNTSQEGNSIFWDVEVVSCEGTPSVSNIEIGGPINTTVSIASMQLDWGLKLSYTCGIFTAFQYPTGTSANSWYTYEQ